jgi:hypothetical protein
LKIMTSFIDKVRAGKILQPTQKGFQKTLWDEAFASEPHPTSADTDLHEAGLLFDGFLHELRTELAKGHYDQLARRDRLLGLCALINQDIAVLQEKAKLKRADKKDPMVLMSELIQGKIELPSGIRVRSDEAITSMIDSITLPLDEALRGSTAGQELGLEALQELHFAVVVANVYRVATDLWHSCLWDDHRIERKSGNAVFIVPRDIERAKQHAVTVHRNLTRGTTMAMQAASMWRNQLRLLAKRALVLPRTITEVRRNSRGNPYVIKRSDLHTRRNIPEGLVSQLVASEAYLQSFFDTDLPSAPGLTLRIMYRVWQVLGALCRAELSSRRADIDDDYRWFTSHIIRVETRHLVDCMCRCLDIDPAVAVAASKFLTYEPRADGLWQRPLIPLSDSELLIAAAPILYGELLRISERWLRQGGLNLDQRGPIFEKLARAEIQEAISESKHLKSAIVAKDTVYVGPAGEEIDLLVHIGDLVLVGEAKCQLTPTEPAEKFRFRDRLVEGATQAKRKAKAIEAFPEHVHEALDIKAPLNLVVVPFVLSNTAIYSGYEIDGVGVVDLLYLTGLLGQGGLRTMVTMDRDGELDSGVFEPYYVNEGDAIKRIPELLRKQPVVRVFEPLLQKRNRPVVETPKGLRIAETYFTVSTEGNTTDWA